MMNVKSIIALYKEKHIIKNSLEYTEQTIKFYQSQKQILMRQWIMVEQIDCIIGDDGDEIPIIIDKCFNYEKWHIPNFIPIRFKNHRSFIIFKSEVPKKGYVLCVYSGCGFPQMENGRNNFKTKRQAIEVGKNWIINGDKIL